jgi:uncharacterized protein (DUF2267 family)
MIFNFQKHAQNATEFLKEVARELENPDDLPHAGRVLVAVMHALRDRITPEESVHFISQLPMYIKAAYVDGWKISKRPPRHKTVEEFLADVRNQTPRTAGRDFGDMGNTKKEVEAVLRVIKKRISEGELKDLKSQLPEEISELWEA